MLTKDLILCRSSGNSLYPKFISATRSEYNELAAQMLSIFDDADGKLTRSEIDEQLEQIGQSSPNLKVAMGLRKILCDRIEFAAPSDLDFQAERRKLFHASANVLRNGALQNEEAFRQTVAQLANGPLTGGNIRVYSDLPDNDICQGVRQMTPLELLERYNVALVQGLLLQAKSLELELSGVTTANLRRVLSAVRFHRLACEIKEIAPKSIEHVAKSGENAMKMRSVRMSVDGPGSVLEQARSYGIQLALFFPIVCVMPHWHLRADVIWKERTFRLDLDEHSKLTCRDFGAGYEPEEIKVFRARFKEKNTDWILDDETECLKSPDGVLVVPDFSLHRKGSARRVHVELFHRWHSYALTQRLKELEEGRYPTLAIGVDKGIASKKDVEEQLNSSMAFAQRGFIYRDFPAVDKLLQAIDGVSALLCFTRG